jgi:oligopeptidase B
MTRFEPVTPEPPQARRIPKPAVVHGEHRVDDYHWMREKEDPAVAAYLEAENAYADALMKPTEKLQEKLYQEMLARIQETDFSVPYPERGYLYYYRTEKGKQYRIYCRQKALPPDSPEETTVDLNSLAEGQSFMALGVYTLTDDGRFLAYSTDNTGFRQYTLYIKDLFTGELLPERREKVVSAVWAADNLTLFYTVEDHAKRSYRLYRHRRGEANDALLYEEADERFSLEVSRTRSGAYLLLSVSSHTTAETRYLPADRPEDSWTLLAPREQDHEYEVDHHGDFFYIRTNDRGRNFRLVRAPVNAPGRSSWEEVLPHRPEVMLEGVELFAGHLIRLEREDGLPRFAVLDFETGESHAIEFEEPVFSASPSDNREFFSQRFRFEYESLVTPRSIFDYDLGSRERTLLKQIPVLGGFDPSRYRSERTHALAADGTRIPVSLVYRKGTRRDGSAPLVLYGYGAYGYPLPINFPGNRLSLLDRGIVFALAHVRGGGELGKLWHDQGRMLSKLNSFTDFIAAAEHLIAENYTRPDRLVIEGASAGGLLIGAVLNLRPDLFKAAVMRVPFVDVINSMLDETLPLTTGEFEEWGNPKIREEYEYLKRYCPYSNLARKDYPALLVKTAFNDSQVMYWEPAKYVARRRALKTDSYPLLLKTNMGAGHGGASGRYDFLREVAFDYAFILTVLGITD